MATLPLSDELVVLILECLREGRDGTKSRRDFYSLSSSSRTLRELSNPDLYHHVITDEIRLVPLVRTLVERTELARLVKKLDVMGWPTPCDGPHPKDLEFRRHSYVPRAI